MPRVSSKCCTIVMGIATFLSASFLITTISRYLCVYKNYADVKVGTCTTVLSYIRDDYEPKCTCRGRNCHTTYECLVIEVNLDTSGPPVEDVVFEEFTGFNISSVIPALQKPSNRTTSVDRLKRGRGTLMLFKDETLSECSYHPKCSSSVSLMTAGISRFNATFGSAGTTFRCLYSRNNPGKVLRNLTDEAGYIYQIIFAGVFVLACVCGFIFSVRSINTCDSKQKQSAKEAEQQNYDFATEMQKLQSTDIHQQPVLILQSESGYQLIPQSLFNTQYAMNAINQCQPADSYIYGPPAGQCTPSVAPASNYSSTDCHILPPAGSFIPPAGNFIPLASSFITPAGIVIPSAGDFTLPPGDCVPPAGNSIPPAGQTTPSAGQHSPPSCNDAPPAYTATV